MSNTEDRCYKQIIDRIPIYIADRVEESGQGWPRSLSAVSQMKQDNNNMKCEIEELEAEKVMLREILELAIDGLNLAATGNQEAFIGYVFTAERAAQILDETK